MNELGEIPAVALEEFLNMNTSQVNKREIDDQ